MATSNTPKSGSISKRTTKLQKPILSLDNATTSRTPKPSGNNKPQTSVFARLQAHFLPHVASPSPPPTLAHKPEPLPEPPFVKVRIITWNMNESLPKGDLAPLLGTVPPYEVDPNAQMNLNIPGLSLAPDHLCHIVAVAGQECPTLMGLPMGLGGGLKWEKEKDEKEEDKRKKDNHTSVDHFGTPTASGARTPTAIGARTPSKHQQHHTTGWSAILEDYYSRGVGSIQGAKPDVKTPLPNQSLSSLLSSPDRLQPDHKEAKWTLPSETAEVPKVGPYELLTKERMMGIYLALYVHRDVRPLVEGYSQGSVAAGLMGGRLGNKGGVAISLKFNGTTFLFLGAHLAAHEDKAALRISNMNKIKSELSVEDFLPPDDERKQAEDPTDRFDHTFLCGDLNFRLDITRLHAEWLISRREYEQAQEFDQLRKIMKEPGSHTFAGFQEAIISFPPTFKYDILRTLRGSKRDKQGGKLKRRALSEVEEKLQEEVEHANQIGTPLTEDVESDLNGSIFAESDGSSSEDDDDEEVGEDNESRLERKAKTVAKKVKRKWYSFLKSTTSLPARSPPSARTPEERKEASSTSKVDVFSQPTKNFISPSRSNTLKSPPPVSRMATSVEIPRRSDGDPRPGELARSNTITSATGLRSGLRGNEEGAALDIEDKGVYDTSYKQRVPSWCDRILFKSTVPVSPSPTEMVPPTSVIVGLPESPPPPPPRGMSKMNSLLQALNPRSRTGSTPTTGKKSTSSTGTEIAVPVGTVKSSSQPNGPLRVITALGREEDSPVEISRSGASTASGGLPVITKEQTGEKLRSATSPDIARAGSGASDRLTTLRLQGKRRRSLSATLPRTSEPVELMGRGIPASASTPPLVPLLPSEGAGHTASRLAKADGGGGRAMGLRRIMSLIPGAWGQSHHPPPVTPDASQSQSTQGPSLRLYKKGEVRCLGYQTLSDREMRRLEGRSDHRPVIGHFAIYI